MLDHGRVIRSSIVFFLGLIRSAHHFSLYPHAVSCLGRGDHVQAMASSRCSTLSRTRSHQGVLRRWLALEVRFRSLSCDMHPPDSQHE